MSKNDPFVLVISALQKNGFGREGGPIPFNEEISLCRSGQEWKQSGDSWIVTVKFNKKPSIKCSITETSDNGIALNIGTSAKNITKEDLDKGQAYIDGIVTTFIKGVNLAP